MATADKKSNGEKPPALGWAVRWLWLLFGDLKPEDLPEEIRWLAELADPKEPLGVAVARTVTEIWRTSMLEPLLKSRPRKGREWWLVLAPYVQYLEPRVSGSASSPLSSKDVIACLRSTDYLEGLLEDRELAKQVAVLPGKLSAENYEKLRREGVRRLVEARERQRLLLPGRRAEIVFPLPANHVERPAVQGQLVKAVLRARAKGKWVALIGLSGTGKSSLLAALVRDCRVREAFSARISAVAINPDVESSSRELESMQKSHSLARRIAHGFRLPLTRETLLGEDIEQALKQHLDGLPGLIVVDNVNQLGWLDGLRNLPSGSVGVIATQTDYIANTMGIEGDWRVHLQGMGREEAIGLVEGITRRKCSEEERAEVTRVWDIVDGHPLAIRIAAVGVGDNDWSRYRESIEREQTRLETLDLGAEELSVWSSIRATWKKLGHETQRRLIALCQLPPLRSYDVGAGDAVWGGGTHAATIWRNLEAWQLVTAHYENDVPYYQLHPLVRSFVRHKGWRDPVDAGNVVSSTRGPRRADPERLGLRSWLRVFFWVWRYPLSRYWPRWRWWRVSVPHPPNSRWRWIAGTLPGTKKHFWTLMPSYLRRHGWPHRGDAFLVRPAEWVVMRRMEMRLRVGVILWGSLLAVLAVFFGALAISMVRFQVPLWAWPIWGVLALITMLPPSYLGFYIPFINLRHIIWCRTEGLSFLDLG